MSHKLEIKKISLKYENQNTLTNVSTVLESGNIYGLIGRNGAGKTSLLSLIASYHLPTSGTIIYDGEALFEHAVHTKDIHFGYDRVYQDEIVEKANKYLESVHLHRPYFDKAYAAKLIKKFKIDLNKPLSKYSKGTVAAFHVMLGLANRTPVTIFDEVYLGLDAPTREMFYEELLEEHNRSERMFILSTHLVSEMEHLFDHVLILHEGQLIVDEDFETFTSRGVKLIGDENSVDELTSNKHILHTESLGRTKATTLYGGFTEEEWARAKAKDLEVSPTSLQHLFTHLTKEEA
ncbi:ABC transporter [Virgibacillus halodenitrificans]|uniref:ABC transporter n=1 Tax=Virgibacillus halodenitrificans TaxID=1482 RepID=A0AAC9NJN4_VIRHA|nr:ABC transporter ATP-binding protein [Virgibacillus halodenitrificans]APC47632.1 ABC transporter [Virgibacillus halodenitrificans]MCJ0930446.1 ABC transporter ATP-binding protein [Virgibacillus halodenitrificans]